MKHLFMTIIIFLSMSQYVVADETLLSDQYKKCMDNSGGVTVEMLDCISAETKKQDVLINKAYKEVMGTLTVQRKKQLRGAQRLWIKYRDANCNFYADPEGGTLATVTSNSCFLDEISSRRKELEEILPFDETENVAVEDMPELSNSFEEFGNLINSCENLDTKYEKDKCRKSISLSKYKFTGTITEVSSEHEFTLRVASEHYVDIKGNFKIETVLKAKKSGEAVSVNGLLTFLGSGIMFHHKASLVH